MKTRKLITAVIAILAFAVTTLAQTVPSYVPTNGLVGYWGFNGNANDESGNGNNGTVNGATLTTDRFGNANSAYSFDGLSNWIYITNSTLISNNQMSISCWFKNNGGNDGNIISTGNQNDYFIHQTNSNEITTFIHTNGTSNSVVSMINNNADNWNNFIITYDGLTLKTYVNGILSGSSNASGNIYSWQPDNLTFGVYTLNGNPYISSTDKFYNGKIDDIAIYNRTLTQQEISQLYTATTALTEVAIGNQTWTDKNLDFATYSDGTVIPQVTDPAEWANLTTGAWCYHSNNTVNGTIYGKLYNFCAVAGIWDEASKTDVSKRKSLAPIGYHIPSNEEWTSLTDFLGGQSLAGGKMKATGTSLWNSPNTGATNSSGFAGLPGGYRENTGAYYGSVNHGFWWSSSETNTPMVWNRSLNFNNSNAQMNFDYKTFGFSVRCVKDTTPPPTASAQTFCSPTTVSSLVATGTNLKWYANETGGITLASDVTLSTGTYYVSQTIGTCESPRTPVVISVNDAQITASTTTVCSGNAVAITVTGISNGSSTLPSNLQNGLVGYWPFNGNANDLSGNGNNGTVNGATLTTDRFGNNSAYSFNGTSNYISVPNNSSLSGFTNITISSWINVLQFPSASVSNGLAGLVTKWHGNGNCGGITDNYACYLGSNNQFVGFTNQYRSIPNMLQTPANITNSNWYHLVMVHDSSTGGKFYINGTLVSNYSTLGAICSSTNPLYMGCDNGLGTLNRFLNGKLDDIGIWNRALSSTEISQLYNNATYLWSTGETTATINPTPTETTTYWCDVKLNGVTCRKEITITVLPNTIPTFTPIASSCSGETINPIPTTSTNGITGTWSPVLNNNETTTYTFTPDAGQCAVATTQTIIITTPLITSEISFVAPPATVDVTIGTQVWTNKNLDVSTYRDGTPIPQVTDPIAWAALTTGAWCYYNNDPANGEVYGKLYNWYAVNDPRGLAPAGFHVPTDAEWTTLTTYLGGESIALGKMKEAGTTHWFSPNEDATNSSGFTGLPGGLRYDIGIFSHIGSAGYWWSSSQIGTVTAWGRGLDNYNSYVNKLTTNKKFGFSVRCLRD
jgi:uncharacterized protein (TIGR02145 family)